MTASQIGKIITRTSGSNFLAAHVGQEARWADGYRSYITELISVNQVRVLSSASHVSQGLCLAPTQRNFNDAVDDDTLIARLSYVEFLCQNRFFQPFDVMNTGAVCAGFFIVGLRDQAKIDYCSIASDLEFLIGYHQPAVQTQPLKDALVDIVEQPDMAIFYCANSTRWAQTNTSIPQTDPDTGASFDALTGIAVADDKIGAKDPGGIFSLQQGVDIVWTNSGHIRFFQNRQFSPNLTINSAGQGLVAEDVQKFQAAVAMGYDEKLGFMIWGRQD
jgi:hypothetical protein